MDMHHGVGMLLLAAVAGYWLLERALKQRGRMKPFGQLLSAFIITVSLIGVVCKVAYYSCDQYGHYRHGKGKSGWSCPYTAKTASPVLPDASE